MVWISGPSNPPDWRVGLQHQIDEVVASRPLRAELHLYPANGSGLFAPSAPPRRVLFDEAERRMKAAGYVRESDQKDVIGWILSFRRAGDDSGWRQDLSVAGAG